jgi:hypothetical protein
MPKMPLHFLFFPGMVFHELSHYFACILCGVKVSKVKLFGSSEAFIEHAKPNAWQAVLITLAPFVFGNIAGFFLFSNAIDLANSLNVLSFVFFWLGFSLALFSFPSKQDAINAFSSFIDFYKESVFGKTGLLEKLFWIVLFPFLFAPLVLLLGTMAAFDYSIGLRFLWAIVLFVFSFDKALLASILSATIGFFVQLVSAI